MKSKKSSRTTDRHGQEDLPRTSAFSYLRSRLFHSGSTSPSHGHADNSSSAQHDNRSMDTTPSAISRNPSRSSESTKRPVSVLQVDTLRRRESMAVTKEGLLYKKADFKAFHKASKRDRSWKLYRVVLRGHKLYLYKVSQDSQLQSFSVSPSVSSSVASVQRRIQNPEEIFNDPSLATDYVYGATFTEGDQTVCLLIFKNDLVIGVTTQGQWRIDCRVRLHQLQMDHDDTFIIKLTRERQQRTFESSSSEITAEWIDSFKEAQKASIDRRTKLYDGAHGHPDLEVRDGKVQAGSIEALVHELLYQTADKRSEEYLRAFLLTYSMFTTSAQVLEIFKRYVKVIDVHTRLIQIFTVWCEQFSQDVVGDVATKMLEILDELAATDSTAPDARATKEFVIHTVKRNGEICELAKSNNVATWENCNVVQDIKSASDPDQKIDLSNILASGMMPSLFLRLDPCHFAEQIYLFHLAMHRKHSKDLMSLLSYVPKPQLSTQMLNSLVFTTAAPHFISRMIRHHILVHSQQQDIANASSVKGILSRTRLIEHWIQVGKHLLQLGDMTGWCAVANGLCSLGVIRLKESWKAVKRDLVAQVAQEWVKLLSGYGFFPQDVWMDGWEKQLISDRFARVMFRDEQGGSNSNSNSNSNRSLPFFGTIRQTVDRLRKHVPQTCDGDIIYFQKFYGIYHAVNGGLEKCRERYSQLDLTNMPYPVVGPLQAFFERSVTEIISMPHDFKYLQECSLLCEPRVLGQSFDRHRRSGTLHDTNVAPPSTSVLKFPDVLEGYHLFQDNVRHDLSKKSSLRSVDDHNAPNAKTTQTRSPRVTSRKMFRRRTYSFPPGGAAATSVQDIHDFNILYPEGYLDTVHSKTWLASLASHRQGTVTAKALLDAAHRKDKTWYLVVQDGSLVFKASTLLQSDDSVTAKSVRPSVSSGFLALANKGSSGIRSRSGTLSSTSDTLRVPEDDENNKTAPILVNVKAGTLERLVDVLVDGVSAYNQDMRDQWHLLLSSEGLAAQKQYLAIDEEEFVSAFFVTYRSFCSCPQLLDLLRGKFTGAFESAKTHQRATALGSVFGNPDNVDEQVDWKKVAATQLKIINLMIYWVEEHVYDFVDEIQILEHVARFLQDAQFSLEEWQKTLQEQLRKHQQHQQQRLLDGDSKTAQQIGTAALRRLQELRILFIQKLLSPCYDLKAIKYETECSRKVDEFYRLLLAEQQQPFKAVILKAGSGDSLAFSLAPSLPQGAARLSQYSASTLLRQADKCARQLFASVTLQDWIQTFDVFEAQSMDLYAWLPSRKASHIPSLSSALSSVRDAPSAQQTSYHVPPEDVVISDIFTAIEGARQSMVSPTAFSADDLILALPGAIQYLYCMHFIIRSWAIHEITAPGLTTDARAQHIEKFLQIVVVSKAATEKMVLFPELRDVEDRPRRVPGFVEYAVASALISPEVRLFAKAWMKVAQIHCQAPLDTLENLLDQVEPSEDAHDMALVPSVGWIFDRMLELCTSVPDTYNHRQDMINFDKRRYVFHFLQLIMNAQMDLEEGDGNMCQEEEDGLTFVICPQVNALSWKDLKELAHRENKSLATRGGAARGQRRTLVFNRMIGEQLDRLKRAIKERNRIDKECREQQHKLQKRQLEQAKLLEKQEKKTHQRSHSHSQLPKLNFILRSLRPHSILAMDPTFTAAKASTVINLIHSTTSVASAYTKRENVFRIVTEEGGQYLFQGMNRDDMHEWMQQINNAAREGTAKRQSVFASEEASKGNERRSHYAEEQENTHATLQTGNRKSVYGMELSILMSDGTIPPIVEKCIQEVEKRGLEEVGIYRMAGSGSVVEELKKAFNTNMDAVDLSDPRWADINVVADALKQFLRSIPGSLLTHECYDDFIHASASEDHDQRVYLIKQTLKKLPLPNYILLKRLVGHFVIVTDFEAINHMYATNLAIVFGPTLLQPAPGPASFATTMSNLGHHQTIVKYLILHYHFLFDIEAEEDEPVVESSNVSSVEDSGLAPEQL